MQNDSKAPCEMVVAKECETLESLPHWCCNVGIERIAGQNNWNTYEFGYETGVIFLSFFSVGAKLHQLIPGLELLVGELPWKYLGKNEEVRLAKEELVGAQHISVVLGNTGAVAIPPKLARSHEWTSWGLLTRFTRNWRAPRQLTSFSINTYFFPTEFQSESELYSPNVAYPTTRHKVFSTLITIQIINLKNSFEKFVLKFFNMNNLSINFPFWIISIERVNNKNEYSQL